MEQLSPIAVYAWLAARVFLGGQGAKWQYNSTKSATAVMYSKLC